MSARGVCCKHTDQSFLVAEDGGTSKEAHRKQRKREYMEKMQFDDEDPLVPQIHRVELA